MVLSVEQFQDWRTDPGLRVEVDDVLRQVGVPTLIRSVGAADNVWDDTWSTCV